MKMVKGITLVAVFIFTFFVNRDWFFDYCTRHYCPDTYGTTPLIAFQPNFYISQRCGGIDGDCIPAHWSFSLLVSDVILMVVLSLVLFFIINKLSTKMKPRKLF